MHAPKIRSRNVRYSGVAVHLNREAAQSSPNKATAKSYCSFLLGRTSGGNQLYVLDFIGGQSSATLWATR